MTEIYVIATENQYGYEQDSTDPLFVTEVCYHLGFWDNINEANLECLKMNNEHIPEDDSIAEEPYFVLTINKN